MTLAVVPVKKLENSKQRVGDIFPLDLRIRLSMAMLKDVLTSLGKAASIEGIFVVTPNKHLYEMVVSTAPIVQIITETGKPSLNGALWQAAGLLQSKGRKRMLIIPGDVPLLQPEEIDRLDRLVRDEKVVIVPDKALKGTNGLLLSPPQAIPPCFGPESLKRHISEASVRGLPFLVVPSATLSFDLDTPDDLSSFIKLGHGTRTYHEIIQNLSRFNLPRCKGLNQSLLSSGGHNGP
jgi:2-phospho-L-lactate guanylyltransferase